MTELVRENLYIKNRRSKFFDSWGYNYHTSIDLYRCLTSDCLFTPFVKEILNTKSPYLKIKASEFAFFSSLFTDNKIKTLLMFFAGDFLYYLFLNELALNNKYENLGNEIKFDKNDFLKIDLNR